MRNIFFSFTVLVLGAISAIPVSASEAATDIEHLLSLSIEDLLNLPITSTSFFTDSSLDTGSTVTVITSEYWQARGARRLNDALTYMPGAVQIPSFLGTEQFVIRGYPNSNGGGVQTLLDGVPLNTYAVGISQADYPNIQLNILDSIEVIRGPGSALYGANAFHGVVSLNAFESEMDLSLASLETASNGYYSGAFKSSQEVGQNWRLHIAFSANGQPDQNFEYDYTDLVSGLPEVAERDYIYDSNTTSIKLSSDLSLNTSYKLGFYYNDYNHEGFYHNGSDVPNADLSDINTFLGVAKAEVKHKLSGSSSVSFDVYNSDQGHIFKRILPPGSTIDIRAEEVKSGQRLVYRSEEMLPDTQLSVALEHRDEKVQHAGRSVINPAGVVVLTADLSFQGARRSIDSLLVDGKTFFGNGKSILRYGVRHDHYSDFGNHTTPRLGLIRYLDEKTVVKFLYGNAFKAPTGNELFGAPTFAGDLNLKPEKINTYELVFKKESTAWKSEVVIFQSKWTDGIQIIDSDGNGSPDQYANVGKSTSQGIEASYMREFDHWLIDVNGSYINSRNKTDGVDYVIFPKYILNLAASYRFHSGWLALLNNRIHVDVSRGPDTQTTTAEDLDDYWRVDMGLSKEIRKKWMFFANIRNLFNRDNELPSNQLSARSTNFAGGVQEEEISASIGLRVKL